MIDVVNKSREQVRAERNITRRNAQRRTNNVKSIELKQSKHDASNAVKAFGSAVKELLSAIIAVIKFIARDCWAYFGKFIQFVARKLNHAGNSMDWSDK